MVHKVIIPKSREVNLSFTVPQYYVGEEIEVIAFIKKEGPEHEGDGEILSAALNGAPFTNEDFLNWVENAEASDTVWLKDAKTKWSKKRSRLQKLIS